uniref:Uncharacterized protein n=1 Tax=Fagus sylvatica TaxID=28930 RepID=A0A2N9HJ82_FAGSY
MKTLGDDACGKSKVDDEVPVLFNPGVRHGDVITFTEPFSTIGRNSESRILHREKLRQHRENLGLKHYWDKVQLKNRQLKIAQQASAPRSGFATVEKDLPGA